jgi:hypothetical protein
MDPSGDTVESLPQKGPEGKRDAFPIGPAFAREGSCSIHSFKKLAS